MMSLYQARFRAGLFSLCERGLKKLTTVIYCYILFMEADTYASDNQQFINDPDI